MRRAVAAITGFTGRWAAAGLGVWALGCGGSDAPAVVDEDTISWQLHSPSNVFASHKPSKDAEIKAACKRTGDLIEFRLDQEGDLEAKRPSSRVTVAQADSKAGTCFVTVTEEPLSPELGSPEFVFTDSCKGTDADGGCVLTGGKSGSWDFDGTLTCTKLVRQANDTAYVQLYNSADARDPMIIKLDKCD